MLWYQIHIEDCPKNRVDGLTDALENLGALSVTYDDQYDSPILEPLPGETPLWDKVKITALFDDEQKALLSLTVLQQTYTSYKIYSNTLADEDWTRKWMDDFKPQCFGKNLWICPSWLTPPEPSATNIILDPGLAFGTGNHATTSLCLQWLDGADLAHKSIIDYGCGSGILAIAALKLGASHAYALDIDEQALIATRNNAQSNHIEASQLTVNFPEAQNEKADVIIANILLGPLMSLSTRFHELLNTNGMLVVSGLLAEQVPTLIAHVEPLFKHVSTQTQEDWALVVFSASSRA